MSVSFDDFKRLGLQALVDDASRDAGLNADQVAALKRPDLLLRRAAGLVDNFINGAAIDQGETAQALADLSSVFSVLAVAIENASVRVDANPGRLIEARTTGGLEKRRVFTPA